MNEYIISHLLVALTFLLIGFGMGRPPSVKLPKEKKNQQPIQEPEGDLFNDLLKDEQEERIDTIR